MTFQDILQLAIRKEKRKICLVAAQDEDALVSVVEAYRMGIADVILVGDQEKITEIASEKGLDISAFELINIKEDATIAETAVTLIREGKANVLMKGKIQTSLFLKKVLDRDKGLRTGEVLSHINLFEHPDTQKVMLITDGGVNILPDLEKKKSILRNAVQFLQHMGVHLPKVAVLAAVEKVNADMPATLDAAELVKLNREGQYKGCMIEGPIAMDIAMSSHAANMKGIDSSISEEVDIFLVPNIESGNILAKALIYIAKAKSAGIVYGAKCPIVLTSRSDTSESKLYSIAAAIAGLESNKKDVVL